MGASLKKSIFAGFLAVIPVSTMSRAAVPPSAAELAAISERGLLLAQYDWVAWHSSDAVKVAHPNADASGRYIAHKTKTGWVVDFGQLDPSGNAFLIADEAVQMGAKFQVETFNLPKKDVGWNLSAAKAIEVATKDFGETERPYNIAVLPAEAGGLYVYLYPAQTDPAAYALGGDERYLIFSDG